VKFKKAIRIPKEIKKWNRAIATGHCLTAVITARDKIVL